MSDKDTNFGGSSVLDLRKWWRHVQPKNIFFENCQSDPLWSVLVGVIFSQVTPDRPQQVVDLFTGVRLQYSSREQKYFIFIIFGPYAF